MLQPPPSVVGYLNHVSQTQVVLNLEKPGGAKRKPTACPLKLDVVSNSPTALPGQH